MKKSILFLAFLFFTVFVISLQPTNAQTQQWPGNVSKIQGNNNTAKLLDGSICGMKFNDLNGNGVRDAGEPGLPDWTIKAEPDTSTQLPGPIYVTTDANGNYCFNNLPDGHYFISEIQQSNWNQTAPPGGTYSLTISGGNNLTGYDFGNSNTPVPGSIYGHKFHDINGNGTRDSTQNGMEPLLDGWTIQISGPVNQITVTVNGTFTFSNLPTGTYIVSEVQQAGWIQTAPPSGSFTVNLGSGQNLFVGEFGNAGTNSIKGKLFNDINGNCIQDAGELGLPNWTVRLDPSQLYAFTNATGDYTFSSLGGGTYTVSEIVKTYWGQTCPTSPGTHTVVLTQGQTETDKDFGNKVVQFVQDLAITGFDANYPVPIRTPCCQQEMTYQIYYSNLGSVPVQNATLEINLYPQAQYISTPYSVPALSVPNYQSGPNILTYDLPTPLNPDETGVVYVKVFLDCDVSTTPTIISLVKIEPLATDDIPQNNSMDHQKQATCSHDPNDKSVIPQGCGKEGNISKDDSLIYHIRFQNSGTGPAYRVIIRDTLDTHLDISTVTTLGSSHPNVFTKNGNKLVWTFWDIELPPMATDEPGSQGYVRFTVKQNAGNTNGTVIKNQAGIYFDLNEVVMTNNTVNTISTNPLPVASFEYTKECYIPPCKYNFTYTGGTSGATFLWNFGYGAIPQTSTAQNPEGVYYTKPGLKIVTLQASLGSCLSPSVVQEVIDTIFAGIDDKSPMHDDNALLQSYPNPFNLSTTIEYRVPTTTLVKLNILDVFGNEIAVLVNEFVPSGKYRVTFNASDLPAGIYFYHIQAGQFQETRNLIFMK